MTHFRLTNESVRLVQGMPISIAIRYEITDENIEVSSVTLAEGQLVDGQLALDQKVTEPTEVLISVKVGADGKIAETTAVLKPDSTIDFVLVHTESPNANYYSVQLRGNDHRSIDLNSRFSIIGDLSQLNDFNPELVQVSLRARPSFLDGSGKTIEFDPVLVDEGGFSIEGDLDEPTLFTIEISEHATFLGSFEYLHAIVEPGVNYAVVPLGKEGTYVILSDRGSLHSKLVTSWQFDPEFEALVDTLVANQKIARTGKERKERVEHEKESVRNYRVVAECDHVKLTDKVKSKFIGPYRYAFYSIGDQIVKRRSAALRKVLRDTQDLELARMVFELNWIQFDEDEIISASDTDEKIATLLDLAQKMDQGLC